MHAPATARWSLASNEGVAERSGSEEERFRVRRRAASREALPGSRAVISVLERVTPGRGTVWLPVLTVPLPGPAPVPLLPGAVEASRRRVGRVDSRERADAVEPCRGRVASSMGEPACWPWPIRSAFRWCRAGEVGREPAPPVPAGALRSPPDFPMLRRG